MTLNPDAVLQKEGEYSQQNFYWRYPINVTSLGIVITVI